MNYLNHVRLLLARPRRAWFIALVAVLAAGCHREEITEYHAPKDVPPPEATPPKDTPPPVDTARAEEGGEPQLKYKLPAGWTELGADETSLARFGIRGGTNQSAVVSIVPFPVEGVGELELVNITRRTQKPPLAALTAEEMARLTESIDVGAGKGKLIDFSAAISVGSDAPPGRIIVTIFVSGGITWFVKLAGDTELVAARKPEFLEFLKSLTITRGPSVTATTPAARPSSGAEPSEPVWDVPSGWRKVPPTAMLISKFVISDAGGEADTTVAMFSGEVGGVLANVNRWRGNVGLAPIAAGELDRNVSPLDAPGSRATLVDVSGKDPKTGKDSRLVGIIWPRGGQTWFFKLLGDTAVVAGQKSAFVKFALSARFPNG